MEEKLIGTTSKGNNYFIIPYHNLKEYKPYKSTWSIEETKQFELFKKADEYINDKGKNEPWGNNDVLFSFFSIGKIPIGKDSETLCKFFNKNQGNWHGFPIKNEPIPKNVLNIWFDNKIITECIKKKLIKCKL